LLCGQFDHGILLFHILPGWENGNKAVHYLDADHLVHKVRFDGGSLPVSHFSSTISLPNLFKSRANFDHRQQTITKLFGGNSMSYLVWMLIVDGPTEQRPIAREKKGINQAICRQLARLRYR